VHSHAIAGALYLGDLPHSHAIAGDDLQPFRTWCMHVAVPYAKSASPEPHAVHFPNPELYSIATFIYI
jgi:hypothetical protein